MDKLWNFNHFKFINDNIIKEYSEFNQYQMDIGVQNPLGPGYGFAIDPSLSIYGTDSDSPYVDYYSRLGGSILRLNQISKSTLNNNDNNTKTNDNFINDIDKYTNFKILRIFKNNSLYIDVFISYEFENNEFFGVFKNYNKDNNIHFKTELYTDPNYQYINQEYKLKLSRYIKNKLDIWFNPKNGLYKNLKNNCPVKNIMGETFLLKINSIVELINTDFEKDGNPYIIIKFKDTEYFIKNNDYYYFNYWFKLL